jgi:hypothetical protein
MSDDAILVTPDDLDAEVEADADAEPQMRGRGLVQRFTYAFVELERVHRGVHQTLRVGVETDPHREVVRQFARLVKDRETEAEAALAERSVLEREALGQRQAQVALQTLLLHLVDLTGHRLNGNERHFQTNFHCRCSGRCKHENS